MAKGFDQVEIDEKNVHKTDFSVEGDHYEFLRMLFGLLGDLVNKIYLVYIDDIIVYATSLQERMNSLRHVFNK